MRVPRVVKIVVFVILVGAGSAAGAYGGSFVLEWLLRTTGESGGFEDLAGLAGSLFTFGPLGAAVMAAVLVHPRFDADQARWLMAAVLASTAAGVIAWFGAGAMLGVAVGIWALTVALVVWTMGSRRSRRR